MMSKFLIPVIISVLLLSCASFETKVYVKNQKSPNLSEDELLIYYSPKNNIPDSAEEIGTFSVKLNGGEFGFSSINGMFENLASSIEKEVKKAGGNLIYIEQDNKTESYEFMRGKIYSINPLERTNYSEQDLKNIWETRKPDAIEGIYEILIYEKEKSDKEPSFLRFGVIKNDSINYYMVYLNGFETSPYFSKLNNLSRTWQQGDIYAYLYKTDNPMRFKSKVYSINKYPDENSMIKSESGNLRISSNGALDIYVKVYPEKSTYESIEGSLTGFAINDKQIMTCYHGVKDNDYKIYVKGINGNFDTKYEVKVEYSDRNNDLALLKFVDTNVTMEFNPLCFSNNKVEIAENIFVLGYPISSVMGEEIKFSNGSINSTSGISGNTNTYQISAPIQHGNSGSPMFDNNGNLIGIVQSIIPNASNVSFTLKSETVKEFLDKNSVKSQFSYENSIKDLNSTEKVKYLKKSVYLIEVIDNKRPERIESKAELRRKK